MSVTFKSLETILDQYPPNPEHLISALQDVQAKFSYIPKEAMTAVCDHLGVPVSRGWAVATFYKAFSLEPKGEHEISVCLGTACHVRGARNVYEKFRRDLAIPGEEGTTKDLKFTLRQVRCLGCCSMAPVAQIDEEVHGGLSQRKAGTLLKQFRKR
ncbi:MAG: NAD(P)H-dependent oxidoreductase subunit E [Deltaproteobacteria bacterium]|nr:NAD(P)H-dependent oxidoreductase subunit E [Deltaproteobacteria bacterium]